MNKLTKNYLIPITAVVILSAVIVGRSSDESFVAGIAIGMIAGIIIEKAQEENS